MVKKKTAPKKAAAKKPAKRPALEEAPPRASAQKPAISKKKLSAPAGWKELGRVVAFFRIPVVAVIRVMRDSLKTGDRIWIKGHTTDLKLAAASMQIDHQPISQVKKGAEVGVKVASRVRIGDRVYRIAG